MNRDVMQKLLDLTGWRGREPDLLQALQAVGIDAKTAFVKGDADYYDIDLPQQGLRVELNYFAHAQDGEQWGLSQVMLTAPAWRGAWFYDIDPSRFDITQAKKLLGESPTVFGDGASSETRTKDGRVLCTGLTWKGSALESHQLLSCVVCHMGGYLIYKGA